MRTFSLFAFMVLSIVLFSSCSNDDEKDDDLDFRQVSPSEMIGQWGRSSGSKFYYYTFSSETEGSYTFIDKNSSSSTEKFSFSYKISETDSYIMEYTKSDGIKEKTGIGVYKWGNLMIGSKEYYKIDD